MAEATMRLDRFLWFARLSATRACAQRLATDGHLRIDGRAARKAAAVVRIGQVLTFPAPGHAVLVVRIIAFPARRGPAAEAQSCYVDLNAPIDGGPVQS